MHIEKKVIKNLTGASRRVSLNYHQKQKQEQEQEQFVSILNVSG